MNRGIVRRLAGSVLAGAVLVGSVVLSTSGCGLVGDGGGSGQQPVSAPAESVAPVLALGRSAPSALGGRGADGLPTVVPAFETELFPGADSDVADDSAIWRDPARPERSLVLLDDKSGHGGVGVYDLRGRLRHYERTGTIGNIDVRDGVRVGGRTVTLVAANDRSDDLLRLWALDPAGATLTPLEARDLHTVTPNYGFCLGRSGDGAHTYAIVTQRDGGTTEQYELVASSGRLDAHLVRTLHVGSQSEGCAVDDAGGALYIGEEDVGLWRYGLDPASGSARTAVDRVGQGRLTADVEGVALTRDGAGRGVLVVSSQGDSTFAVYDLDHDQVCLGRFRVAGSGGVDGVSHSDGVAVAAGAFGPDFPNGLLVVHDGENSGDGGRPEPASDVKFVRLDRVVALAPLP